jgi:hypothetical protein
MPAGRPTEFHEEYVEQAAKLCALGATDVELADFFEVDVRTIYRWKHTQPEFCQALNAGKEKADARVENSLYQKAVGYTFESEKIFQHQGEIIRAPVREHVPPDTTAAIFWLKNRSGANWKDKHEHNVSVQPIVIAKEAAAL